MLLRSCGVGVLVFIGATGLCGQTVPQPVPFTAKTRTTRELIVNGNVVETHVQEGIFLRTSAGLELQQEKKYDGKDLQGPMGWGNLFDRTRGITYSLDYKTRNAYEEPPVTFPAPPKQPPSGAAQLSPLGEDFVEGIPCKLGRTWLVVPGKGDVLSGTSCWSMNYNLELKRDQTFPPRDSSGRTWRIIHQLYDIQLGVEPDPKLFDLHSFTIHPLASKN